MLPIAVPVPVFQLGTPPTVGTSDGARHMVARRGHHVLAGWDDETAAPEAAADVEVAGAGLVATPMSRSAPSRWASAAATATAAATSLPGAAFRESATLRASFWLCRNCDKAWALDGAAGLVCPDCNVARSDMQLQAGATEVTQVRELVQSSAYGRSLNFANRNEQPIGPPPAAFANPNAPDFAETVRSAALRLLGPGVSLTGGRTDAIMTFESWLLLMYDAAFSVYACTLRTRDSHHAYSRHGRRSRQPYSAQTQDSHYPYPQHATQLIACTCAAGETPTILTCETPTILTRGTDDARTIHTRLRHKTPTILTLSMRGG